MLITVFTTDSPLALALGEHAPAPAELTAQEGVTSWQAGVPEWTPGATGGWWELAVDIGVVAAPVSVVCNLIASWVWSAWEKARTEPARPVEVTLMLRDGERVAELRVSSSDTEAARAAILAAVTHVHPRP